MNDWFVTPPPVDLGQLDWVTKHHAGAHRQRFLALAAHPEPREGGVLFRLTLDDPAMRALGWRVGDELAMAVAHGWVAVRRLPPHQGAMSSPAPPPARRTPSWSAPTPQRWRGSRTCRPFHRSRPPPTRPIRW